MEFVTDTTLSAAEMDAIAAAAGASGGSFNATQFSDSENWYRNFPMRQKLWFFDDSSPGRHRVTFDLLPNEYVPAGWVTEWATENEAGQPGLILHHGAIWYETHSVQCSAWRTSGRTCSVIYTCHASGGTWRTGFFGITALNYF